MRGYLVSYTDAAGCEHFSRAFTKVRNARKWAKRLASAPGVVRVDVRHHD